MKGLYIHIPFCNSICTYCDFVKQIAKDNIKDKYIDRLIEEINIKRIYLNDITSVYIGGGTPNSLSINNLEKLFISIKDILFNSIENTIECNPELINEEFVKLISKYNINRVSIGVETIVEKSLKLINRHHNKDIVINSINLLHKYNITNINVDMISSIPNTTIDDLNTDLDFVLSLPITHISYYSLILEEKSVLYHLIKNNKLQLLDEELDEEMSNIITNRLTNNNYNHYEISNYSKEGYESIHNLLYWTQGEYIGVGVSAASFFNNIRSTNNYSITKYNKEFLMEEEYIDINTYKNEYLMLGLRLIKGVSISKYYNLFNSSIFDDYNLDKWLKLGFLIIDNDNLYISKDKLNLANLIYEEFV